MAGKAQRGMLRRPAVSSNVNDKARRSIKKATSGVKAACGATAEAACGAKAACGAQAAVKAAAAEAASGASKPAIQSSTADAAEKKVKFFSFGARPYIWESDRAALRRECIFFVPSKVHGTRRHGKK